MIKKTLTDFHLHSRYSDGSDGIASIIKEAKKRNVKALALTDHNTNSGVGEFMVACKKDGIIGLEGTEIYTNFPEADWSKKGCGQSPDVVIIGKKLKWKYLIEYQEKLVQYQLDYWLPATLDGLRSAGLKVPSMTREEMLMQIRNKEGGLMVPSVLHDVPKNPENWSVLLNICRQFDKSVNICIEDVKKQPVRWANKCLYNLGGSAYISRVFPEWSIKKTVQMAKDMNGILFAAHPGTVNNWTDEHISYFIDQGGEGIEVWQYKHSKEQINRLFEKSKKHNLIVSGGSDWHGKNGDSKLGCWDKPSSQMPDWVLQSLLECLP